MSVTTKRRPVLAWCPVCEAPFHAGEFGGGVMALGPRGQDVYIGRMRQTAQGEVDLRGSTAKCPVCDNMGQIQDGLYDTVLGVVRESARIFRSLTTEESAALAEVLRQRQQGQVDDAAVVAATPSEAKDWIGKVLKRVDKKFWISILLAVLLAVQSNLSADSSTQSIQAEVARSEHSTHQQIGRINRQDEQLRELVQELLNRLGPEEPGKSQVRKPAAAKALPPVATRQPPDTMPTRNAPCWCGSGRRFKRCHKGAS